MSPADPPSTEAETEASVPPAPASEATAGPAAPATAEASGATEATEATTSPVGAEGSSSSIGPPAVDSDAAARADAGPRLKALFPALFVGASKPIKLRIQQDIQARAPGAFTRQALSAFFRRYTGSTAYLHAVASGRERFDLDGQPAGPIADEHRQAAREELARRRGRQEERRALEEQQRRNRAGLLRDFERTTLTRANFCALKQIDEAELDGVLAIARAEAAQVREAPRDRPALRTPVNRPERRPPNAAPAPRKPGGR